MNPRAIADTSRAALIAREEEIARQMLRVYAPLRQQLIAKIADLKERLPRVQIETHEALTWQVDRAAALLRQVEDEEAICRKAAHITEGGQRAGGQLGLDLGPQVARAAQVAWNSLPVNALEHLVGFSEDGKALQKHFQALAPERYQAMRQTLATGMAQGHTPYKIARALTADVDEFTLRRSTLIARQETVRAFREAAITSYAANADIVDGWVWTAVLTARCCAACVALDGTLHPIDEAMGSHVSCRCIAVPHLAIGDAPRLQENGADWLAQQDRATQDGILGKAKGELYRQGKITPQEMVDRHSSPWGPTANIVSLKHMETIGVITREERLAALGKGEMPNPGRRTLPAGPSRFVYTKPDAPPPIVPPFVVPVTPPPTAPEITTNAWKPTMTEAEADAWSQGSALRGDYYHGTGLTESGHITDPAALYQRLTELKGDGFRLIEIDPKAGVGSGNMMGRGVYITPNQENAERYGAVLRIRINVKKAWTEKDAGISWAQQYGKIQREAKKEGVFSSLDPVERIAWWVKKHGYDAIENGFQTIVFDPRNIVIVESRMETAAEALRKFEQTRARLNAAEPGSLEWKLAHHYDTIAQNRYQLLRAYEELIVPPIAPPPPPAPPVTKPPVAELLKKKDINAIRLETEAWQDENNAILARRAANVGNVNSKSLAIIERDGDGTLQGVLGLNNGQATIFVEHLGAAGGMDSATGERLLAHAAEKAAKENKLIRVRGNTDAEKDFLQRLGFHQVSGIQYEMSTAEARLFAERVLAGQKPIAFPRSKVVKPPKPTLAPEIAPEVPKPVPANASTRPGVISGPELRAKIAANAETLDPADFRELLDRRRDAEREYFAKRKGLAKNDPLRKELRDRMEALSNEVERRRNGISQEIEQLLKSDTRGDFSISYVGEKTESLFADKLRQFAEMMDDRPEFSRNVKVHTLPEGERAFHQMRPSINGLRSTVHYAPSDGVVTVAHEMGHYLERNVPEINSEARAFLARRTAGEEAQSLNKLTKSTRYADDEIAKPDKFMDEYVGKIYKDGATEVISMGIQYMVRNPALLAEKDPELFDLIWRIMRRIPAE
jgi:N-acetylglutamate synthase-like GNAT family acetyltransferase